MDSTASTTNGLATPPLPAAQPLVYITGSSQPKKQCVAEYLALLLGDEAVLIDPPRSTGTPPPPSSTLPDDHHPSRERPRRHRLPSSASSNPSRSRSASTSTSTSTSTLAAPIPRPFSSPLLSALSSHPLRTAILTSPSPQASISISPSQAASQTGRPLICVRLLPASTCPPPADPTATACSAAAGSATLDLREEDGDPHAAALRIVQFVKETQARRRRGCANEGGGGFGTGTGRGNRNRGGCCVCGVITPVLTPAEEREIRF